jgi:predicted phage-related endonuclease
MTLTPAQRAARSNKLGGSDAAAVLGLSRFKPAQKLYYEKRGEFPVESVEKEWLRLGELFEPVGRQMYVEATGRTIRQPTGTLTHPEHAFMVAHVDGISGDPGPPKEREVSAPYKHTVAVPTWTNVRGYEGKLALRYQGWGQEGTDQVPMDALIQTQHYMAVTGLVAFDVVVLMGFKIKPYLVPADPEFQGMIIEAETEFMNRLELGTPPPLDYAHPRALEFIRELYPEVAPAKHIPATDEAIRWRRRMEKATRVESLGKKFKEQYRVQLLESMADAALLDFPDGRSFRRLKVTRAGYVVAETEYVEARMINTPKKGCAL